MDDCSEFLAPKCGKRIDHIQCLYVRHLAMVSMMILAFDSKFVQTGDYVDMLASVLN